MVFMINEAFDSFLSIRHGPHFNWEFLINGTPQE